MAQPLDGSRRRPQQPTKAAIPGRTAPTSQACQASGPHSASATASCASRSGAPRRRGGRRGGGERSADGLAWEPGREQVGAVDREPDVAQLAEPAPRGLGAPSAPASATASGARGAAAAISRRRAGPPSLDATRARAAATTTLPLARREPQPVQPPTSVGGRRASSPAEQQLGPRGSSGSSARALVEAGSSEAGPSRGQGPIPSGPQTAAAAARTAQPQLAAHRAPVTVASAPSAIAAAPRGVRARPANPSRAA